MFTLLVQNFGHSNRAARPRHSHRRHKAALSYCTAAVAAAAIRISSRMEPSERTRGLFIKIFKNFQKGVARKFVYPCLFRNSRFNCSDGKLWMSPTIFFFLFNFHGLRLFNYLLEVEHIFTPSSINAKLHIIGSEIPPIVKTGLESINNSHQSH